MTIGTPTRTSKARLKWIESNFRSAIACHKGGRLSEAKERYQEILDTVPDHGPSLNNLGTIFLQEENHDSAIACFREAVDRQPKNADAWNNLGVLLSRTGLGDEALDCFQNASGISPEDPEIQTNLGDAWRLAGDLNRAETHHRKALSLDPKNAKALNNLALLQKAFGRLKAAVALFKEALLLDPTDEQIHFNLGTALIEAGNFAGAVSVSEAALQRFPHSITTAVGAARVLVEAGQWEKADPLIHRAVRYPYTTHDLPVLRHLLLYINAVPGIRADIAHLHFCCGRLIHEKWKAFECSSRFPFENRFKGLSKIRIGYVSPDFNRHSVGWFFREIIRHHDTDRFEIYCYALADKQDDITDKIRAKAEAFHRVAHLSEMEIASQIFKDRIQILVDLTGYTRNNRLDVFALGPAPVQITAIGYPHGTGLPSMDYRISDGFVEGDDAESEYRERLLSMPDCFLPYPNFKQDMPAVTRDQLGVTEALVVFASFNAWHKLRPEVLRLWNQILHSAPKSVLVFSFRYAETPYARKRIHSYFDVAPDRIRFLPQTDTESAHRARYGAVDIALDPFPYNGTTTSWEALYMGVPVVTLRGDRHVQRTTWTLLANLNLGMLAVDTPPSYIDLAVRLATEPSLLNRVKNRVGDSIKRCLNAGNSAYACALEDHYHRAWQRFQRTPHTPHP
jgi:protein O-GlcNAc transferase